MTKTSLPQSGGCQCGKLRYRVSQPPLMIYCCHCTNCQKISGSAFAISATIVETSFEFTAGEAKKTEWRSDAGNQRYGYICGDCGIRIAHGQTPSSGMLSLRAGTFDDASWIEPSGHIWTKSAMPWVQFNADDILYDGQPTDYAPLIEKYKSQDRFGG
jgi:hypothetical protein